VPNHANFTVHLLDRTKLDVRTSHRPSESGFSEGSLMMDTFDVTMPPLTTSDPRDSFVSRRRVVCLGTFLLPIKMRSSSLPRLTWCRIGPPSIGVRGLSDAYRPSADRVFS